MNKKKFNEMCKKAQFKNERKLVNGMNVLCCRGCPCFNICNDTSQIAWKNKQAQELLTEYTKDVQIIIGLGDIVRYKAKGEFLDYATVEKILGNGEYVIQLHGFSDWAKFFNLKGTKNIVTDKDIELYATKGTN